LAKQRNVSSTTWTRWHQRKAPCRAVCADAAADRLAFRRPRHRPHHHAIIATQGYKPRRRRRVYSAHCPPPLSLAQAYMAPARRQLAPSPNSSVSPAGLLRRRASVQFPGMPVSALFPFLLVYLRFYRSQDQRSRRTSVYTG
jgi:hypothetical protein